MPKPIMKDGYAYQATVDANVGFIDIPNEAWDIEVLDADPELVYVGYTSIDDTECYVWKKVGDTALTTFVAQSKTM